MMVLERGKIKYAGVESGAGAHTVLGLDPRGFTLVELLVVVCILAALATIALPFFSGYTKTAKNGRCVSDLRTIDNAITSYVSDNNSLPPGNNLSLIGTTARQLDPWGKPYVYQNLAAPGAVPLEDEFGMPLNTDYDLYSTGAPGSGNDIARFNNGTFMGARNPDAP